MQLKNGLNQLHKQLLHYFKTDNGHNSYAIEMLISVIQNEVFLNVAEAHQCTWAATSNSKGGKKKNIEIDLLQENINADLKKMIKNMGANKTDKRFLYVCMVNTIYLLSFVETPRKFIIAELSIRKLGFSSVLIIRLFEFTRPFLYIKCRDCMLA